MKNSLLAALGALALPLPSMAADPPPPATPNDIVAAAPAADWKAIAPADLMVMELARDAKGKAQRVVIQMMPAPFSQGWVDNVRTLAAARWFDRTAVIRSQDNYVVQWGDPGGDNPKTAKALPPRLRVMAESEYLTTYSPTLFAHRWGKWRSDSKLEIVPATAPDTNWKGFSDPYASAFSFVGSFPVGMRLKNEDELVPDRYTGRPRMATFVVPKELWPVHCYGMVGVGRGLSPDTGSGAELYVVIGTPPRQLDRNIALVGRVIEGMEFLSTLPRGTGPLGFYETPEEYTPIVSVRMGSDVAGLPTYEYLSTESASFAAYAEKRANRKDDFYIQPAGGVDVCNVPVPIRRAGSGAPAPVGK